MTTRFELSARAARVERIVRFLRDVGEPRDSILRRIDFDTTWFKVWTAALGTGARCPSDETRALVRQTIEREHDRDEHCDLDPDTDVCRVCRVWHGSPCVLCGKRGFHDVLCGELRGQLREIEGAR